MMKMYLLILMLGVMSCAFAQKLRTNVTDKFTGDSVQTSNIVDLVKIYTESEYGIGYTHLFEFYVSRVGKKYTMYADIVLPNKVELDEQSGVVFLLDNGEKVLLKSNQKGRKFHAMGNGYMVENRFDIPAAEVRKLQMHSITDLRYQYVNGHYDKAIKGNKQTLLQRVMGLFR